MWISSWTKIVKNIGRSLLKMNDLIAIAFLPSSKGFNTLIVELAGILLIITIFFTPSPFHLANKSPEFPRKAKRSSWTRLREFIMEMLVPYSIGTWSCLKWRHILRPPDADGPYMPCHAAPPTHPALRAPRSSVFRSFFSCINIKCGEWKSSTVKIATLRNWIWKKKRGVGW